MRDLVEGTKCDIFTTGYGTEMDSIKDSSYSIIEEKVQILYSVEFRLKLSNGILTVGCDLRPIFRCKVEG